MRFHMPYNHRAFLNDVESTATIRLFVEESRSKSKEPRQSSLDISSAYDEAVTAVLKLRARHIQLVTGYIIVPSRSLKTSGAKQPRTRGTGGTQPMPFLKQVKHDTKKVLCQGGPDSPVPMGK